MNLCLGVIVRIMRWRRYRRDRDVGGSELFAISSESDLAALLGEGRSNPHEVPADGNSPGSRPGASPNGPFRFDTQEIGVQAR